MVIYKKNHILSYIFAALITINTNIHTAQTETQSECFEHTIKKIPHSIHGMHQAVEIFNRLPEDQNRLKHAHIIYDAIDTMRLETQDETLAQDSILNLLLKKINIMQFSEYVTNLPHTLDGIKQAYTTFETLPKDEYTQTFSSLLFTFIKNVKIEDQYKQEQELYLNGIQKKLSNYRFEQFVTELPQTMYGVQKAYKKFISLPYNNDLFLPHATRLYEIIKNITLSNPEHIKQRHTLLRNIQKALMPTIKTQGLLEEPMFGQIVQDFATMSPQQQSKRSCHTPPTPLTLKTLEQHNRMLTTTTQDYE